MSGRPCGSSAGRQYAAGAVSAVRKVQAVKAGTVYNAKRQGRGRCVGARAAVVGVG